MSFKNLHLSDQLPTQLGQTDSSASLSVVLASDYALAISLDNQTGAGATTASTLRVVIATDQTAVPASQSGTWDINNISGTVSLPTGAATEVTLGSAASSLGDILTYSQSIDSSTALTASVINGAKGSQLKAASLSITLATDQGALDVAQSGSWSVSVADSALPTGAATEAKQDTGNTSLAAIDTKLAGSLTVQATDLDIRDLSSATDSIAAVQSGAWSIADITGTVSLPTGAATEATLSALSGKVANGAGTSAGAVRVTLASDSPDLAGRDTVLLVNQDLAAVTASAYTELSSATSADINALVAFESSGQGLILATGAAASEVDILYIPPGGTDGVIPVSIPSGSRLSIKSLLDDSTAGDLVASFLS